MDFEAATTETVTEPTVTELSSSVVDGALAPTITRKSQISASEARCLYMQTKKHETEMDLLVLKII